jgi:hypothetical protein
LSVGQIAYIPRVENISIINGTPVNISGASGNIILGTSFLNSSAGSNVVSVGVSGALNNTGSFVNALGYYAGASNTYSNCTFIGSNPNATLRYSTSSSSIIIANFIPSYDPNPNTNGYANYLVYGNDGNLYVAVAAGGIATTSIFRIPPTSTISSATPNGTYTVLTNALIGTPASLIQAVDASDSLYILNQGDGKIVKFSQTTGTFALMYGGTNPPTDYYSYGLAQSALTCNFYITSRISESSFTINAVDYASGVTTTLSSGYPARWTAITYASDNFLYAVNTAGNMYKVNPTTGSSTVVGNYTFNAEWPRSLYAGDPGYIYLTYFQSATTRKVSLANYTSTLFSTEIITSITQAPDQTFYGVTRLSRVLLYGTLILTYLPAVSQANTFAVYSTVSGLNTIQADTSNNYVGIGMAPGAYALDVSGTARMSNLIVSGTSSLSGNVTISGLLSLSALNVLNALNISGLLTVSATTIQNNLTVGGTTISAGSAVTTLSAVNVQNAATISGLATLSAATVLNSLTVQGTTLSAGSSVLSVCSAVVRTTLSVGQIAYIPTVETLSTINGTSVNICGARSNLILGTSSLNSSAGSNVVSVGASGAFNNTGSFVNTLGYYAGSNNTGSYTNALGYYAGASNTYSNCTFIGSNPNTAVRYVPSASSTIIANIGPDVDNNAGNSFDEYIVTGNDGYYYCAVNRNFGPSPAYNSIFRISPTSTISSATPYGTYTGLSNASIACPTALIQAADASDSLYILNFSNSKIVKFSQTTGSFTLMYGGATPVTTAFSSYGLAQSTLTCNFYFTNSTDNVNTTIQTVVYATGVTTVLSSYPVFFRVIAYASDNYLYSWVTGGNLHKIDPTTGASSIVGNYVTGYNATGLYSGVSGYIYITNSFGGPALRVTLSDYTSTTAFSEPAPVSITRGANDVFYGITRLSQVVVYGTPTFTYLPGATQANTFALYSTVSGVNTIQADTSNNYVGIGRVPGAYTLDVAGTTRTSNLIITGAFTMSGSLTIPDALNLTSLVVSNAANMSGLLTVSAVLVQNNLTVSGLTTLSATTTTTLSATSLRTSTLLGITSINTMSATINSASDNFLIGGASGPYVAPTGGFVTAIGKGAALGSTGSNIVGLGFFASASATGTHINAIGYQAGFLGTADYQNVIGYQAGKTSTATNLTAIGYTAGENNKGTSNIVLGDFAGSNQTGSSNVALGLRSLINNSGSLTIGIGYNAGVSASANGCIYIGRGAGSNNIRANSVFIGSNPGYSAGADNQFVVYSISSSLPLIQGDLSFNRVGIGRAPGPYALDVSGTIQTTNISLAQLNGLTWPAGTPGGSNYVPTYSNGTVSWLPGGGGGGGGAAAWSSYPATQVVDLAGYDLSGLVSINSISAVFVTASSKIGFGRNVLSGNTGSNVIALGSNAGSGGTESNVVYIGNNPGYNPGTADTFVVYSTNIGLPLIEGNLASRSVGIGRVPRTQNALDVSGRISATSIVTSVGSSNILGPITTTTDSLVLIGNPTPNPQYKLDVNGTVHVSNIIATGAGGSNLIGGITLQNSTLSAATVVVPTLSNVSLLNGWQVSTSLTVGNFGIGTLLTPSLTNAISIGPGAATNASGAYILAFGNSAASGSRGDHVYALGHQAASNSIGSYIIAIGHQSALGNSGTNVVAVGELAASSNRGTNVNAFGAEAAIGNTANDVNSVGYWSAWDNSGNDVNAFGTETAYSNRGSNVNAFGNQAAYVNSGSNVNAIGNSAALSNSANHVDAIGWNAGYRNSGAKTVALGLSAGCFNSGNNVISIGEYAGFGNGQSNCTFIGRNPNAPTSGATGPNTFLVYSTSATAPTIQADTSNNRVGIGRVPASPYTLDVAGPIRTTSNIVNTINVSLISSSTFNLLIDNYSTYFSLVYTGGSTVTISLPGSLPIQGSYWVVKNNSVVNYTLNFTGGTLNTFGGPTSMYLQAGNGMTLIYAGANSVYYTF